ncbi:hypothetical protein Goshw_005236, partial [Gossypium schwendimanii]|nr:hypothetical protein [Gossypium schwendimanii]
KIFVISTLCGGEILFIIFSPIGKPFLFGYPSVQSATKQFLNPSQSFNETIYAPVEALSKVRLVGVIEILDKQVDTYLTVSLYRSMSGFIKRLVWVQNSFSDSFNRRMTK